VLFVHHLEAMMLVRSL